MTSSKNGHPYRKSEEINTRYSVDGPFVVDNKEDSFFSAKNVVYVSPSHHGKCCRITLSDASAFSGGTTRLETVYLPPEEFRVLLMEALKFWTP